MLRTIRPTVLWEAILFCIIIASLAWAGTVTLILVLGLCAFTLVIRAFHSVFSPAADPFDYEDSIPPPPALDPWGYQRKLMEMSGQRVPRDYRMHNGVILYGALVMEEAGEMFGNLSAALWNGGAPTGRDLEGAKLVAEAFADQAAACGKRAAMIRQVLKEINVDFPLSVGSAASLFDDTTDVAVVNCGFAQSCGFPGAAGYREVGDSNHSKADPASGKIEKTADGKWIKGPNYFEPDLARVLREHSRPTGGAGGSALATGITSC